MNLFTASLNTANTSLDTGLDVIFKNVPNGALPIGLNGGAWAVLNGVAKNTPVEGPNLLTDGSLENWTNNDLDDWVETVNGASIVTQDQAEERTGASCARVAIDSSGNSVRVGQVAAKAIGDFIISRMYSKATPTDGAIRLNNRDNLNSVYNKNETNVYAERNLVSLVKDANGTTDFESFGNPNDVFYVDDLETRVLDKQSIFFFTEDRGNLQRTKAYVLPEDGTISGVLVNADTGDANTMQNYLLLVKVGTTNPQVYLWKVVGGVPSQVVAQTIDENVVNGLVELRQTAETTYQIYFNGILQGPEQTIVEPTINNNGYHGVIQTHANSSIEAFCCRNNTDVSDDIDNEIYGFQRSRFNVTVVDEIDEFSKYLSAGDIMNLPINGDFTFADGHPGFSLIKKGTEFDEIIIRCNGTFLRGGTHTFRFNNDQEYIRLYDYHGRDYTITGISRTDCWAVFLYRGTLFSDGPIHLDSYKTRGGGQHQDWYCEGDGTGIGADTVDGFEDWNVKGHYYYRCKTRTFNNGLSGPYNNGHGFEVYAAEIGEFCEDIIWDECEDDGSRVGFSCEGGGAGEGTGTAVQVNHVNIQAIDCKSINNEIAECGAVFNGHLQVTAGTLQTRITDLSSEFAFALDGQITEI